MSTKSLDDYRRTFFGTTDEEFEALKAAAASGTTLVDLINNAIGSQFEIDTAGTTTSTINYKARGATPDSSALMRLMPNGIGADATTGDRAEFSLMGVDVNQANRWWADMKVRERPSDDVRFFHILTDREGTAEPITQVVIEIDGGNESAAAERFRIVRNSWIDAAAGIDQIMLDIDGAVGIQGIAQNKLAINDLKIGPTAAADTTVFLHDGADRAAITRQNGANADLLFRNFGTGNVIIRPADNPSNDIVFGSGSVALPNGYNLVFGTTTGSKIGATNSQKMGFWGNTPVVRPSGWQAATGTATRTTFATGTVLLSALAERVKALIDDLTNIGLIG